MVDDGALQGVRRLGFEPQRFGLRNSARTQRHINVSFGNIDTGDPGRVSSVPRDITSALSVTH